jgi:hypothetical protein
VFRGLKELCVSFPGRGLPRPYYARAWQANSSYGSGNTTSPSVLPLIISTSSNVRKNARSETFGPLEAKANLHLVIQFLRDTA